MNSIVYLVGAVVIIVVVLKMIGRLLGVGRSRAPIPSVDDPSRATARTADARGAPTAARFLRGEAPWRKRRGSEQRGRRVSLQQGGGERRHTWHGER